MSFIEKGRSIAVAVESTYGTAPTFVDADYIDYTSADMSADVEKIDRNVIRNSMVKLEPVLGMETSSGSITVEVSSAVSGATNGGVLYTNGIGKRLAQATATTASTGTTTSVTVASATGLSVGQVIRVNLDASTTEYVQITAIASNVLTVYPAFSQAPTSGDAVQGLTTFILPKPNDSISPLSVREFLNPTSGSTVQYTYSGCMVSSVKFDYPVGGIATCAFSIAGAGFDIMSGATAPTLPCTLQTPIIGKFATVKVGSTSHTAQDLSFSIDSEITDIKAITAEGISNKVAVGKTVTGSFKVEMTGITNFDSFQTGTKAALTLLLKSGGASSAVTHGIVAPSIKFTKVSKSFDGGIAYETIEFEVLAPDCGTVERAVSVFFA